MLVSTGLAAGEPPAGCVSQRVTFRRMKTCGFPARGTLKVWVLAVPVSAMGVQMPEARSALHSAP